MPARPVHIHAAIFAMLLSLAFGAPVLAAGVPQAIKSEIAAIVGESGGTCRLAGWEKAVREVDIDGDGAPDHIVNLGELDCDMATLHCGASGGCQHQIWVTRGGGPVRVFEGQAVAVEIPAKGRVLLKGIGSGSGMRDQLYRLKDEKLVPVT